MGTKKKKQIHRISYFDFLFSYSTGLNEILNPDKSPNRKKRHDISSYEQEIRNKLNVISPLRSISVTPSATHSPLIVPPSPSDSYTSDNPFRPPLSAITPTKANFIERTKPRPLNKRMNFKRTLMQKFKMSKNNR